MRDEYDINDMRKAVEDYFASKPPADIIPKPGLEREALLGLNLLVEHEQVVTTQGGRIAVNGDDVTITPAEVYTERPTAPIVTRAVLERTGLTEAEVPNLTVID